jgi:hypothetical protein
MTDAETVARLANWLVARKVKTKNRRAGQVCWYVVSQLLGCGCTAANEWCQERGIDPNMRVRGRV